MVRSVSRPRRSVLALSLGWVSVAFLELWARRRTRRDRRRRAPRRRRGWASSADSAGLQRQSERAVGAATAIVSRRRYRARTARVAAGRAPAASVAAERAPEPQPASTGVAAREGRGGTLCRDHGRVGQRIGHGVQGFLRRCRPVCRGTARARASSCSLSSSSPAGTFVETLGCGTRESTRCRPVGGRCARATRPPQSWQASGLSPGSCEGLARAVLSAPPTVVVRRETRGAHAARRGQAPVSARGPACCPCSRSWSRWSRLSPAIRDIARQHEHPALVVSAARPRGRALDAAKRGPRSISGTSVGSLKVTVLPAFLQPAEGVRHGASQGRVNRLGCDGPVASASAPVLR